MFRFYPFIILIQLFCVYHAYSNKSDQKWFWIIIFFPFFGCLIYLYVHFYNRRNLENITEGVKHTMISNYAIKKLEQKVKFAGTHSNKIELASEHLRVGNHKSALDIFESCYVSTYKTDTDLQMKLLQTNYLLEEYDEVVKYGNLLEGIKEFKNSKERSLFAWAYHKIGNSEKADSIFKKMDLAHCNYENRLEYSYFLWESSSVQEARGKANEVLDEINAMDSYERKINKVAIKEFKYLMRQLESKQSQDQ